MDSAEVAIAIEAKKLLDLKGALTRVVSVPSFELLMALSAEDRDRLLKLRRNPQTGFNPNIDSRDCLP